MKRVTLLSVVLAVSSAFCYGQLIDCKELFISEMIEGTAQNKAIEIFNPSDTIVDLDSLSVRIFKDGQVTPDIIQLNGTLAAKSKFVIAHPAANSGITSKADMLDAQINFDGNDAIVLERNGGIQVDKIGEIGVDPGSSGWTCTSGTTKDQTLRRKAVIGKGETDWQQCRQQWDDFPTDNSDDLKEHLGGCGATCNTAIAETAKSTCVVTTYVTGGQETWFAFTASNTDAQIRVVSKPFGTNAPHIHNISLFKGTCTNLNLIAQDELPFIAIAEELTIDASGLVPGNTYYIRANVPASEKPCPETGCPGPSLAAFTLCIQNVDVFQPLDFNLADFGVREIPASSHTYFTNKGQIVDTDGNPRRDIKLYTRGASPNVFVFDDHLSYVFAKADTDSIAPDTLHRVDMTLSGANPNSRVFKTEQTPGYLNYYLGHIPTGIPKMAGYSKAVCNDVYPNIDMQLYSNSEGLKYYFIRRPGGDLDDIELKFKGATSIDVTPDGGLSVKTPLGNIEFDPGHAYAINPGGKVVPMPWQAKFEKVSANSVKFKIHNFNSIMPLIIQVDKGHKVGSSSAIDNLVWSTFLKGVFYDEFTDVTTDDDGNVYICGVTASTNFPVFPGVSWQNFIGPSDMIYGKFDSNAVYQYATFLGGNAGGNIAIDERAEAIAVDAKGNVFMTGQTKAADFPILTTTPQYEDTDNSGGLWDIVMVKFDSTGQLVYSSYYGNLGSEKGLDMALDGLGNIYIVGTGDAATPTFNQSGAFNDTISQHSGLIIKLDSQLVLQWVTRFGGSTVFNNTDKVNAVAIDDVNNVYITGMVADTLLPVNKTDPNFPSTQSISGNITRRDAFIARFDSANSLTHCMYYGGEIGDQGHGIAIDKDNHVLVTGVTASADLPVLDFNTDDSTDFFRSAKTDTTDESDAFVLKFRINPVSDSIELLASTYFGSVGNDLGWDVTVDDSNYVYLLLQVAGDSLMPFPSPPQDDLYIQTEHGQLSKDQSLFAVFDPSFELVWTSFIGGDGDDKANAIATFKDQALYVVGASKSEFFDSPEFATVEYDTAPGSLDHFDSIGGGLSEAGFIMRFSLLAVYIDIPPVGTGEIPFAHSQVLLYPNPGNDLVKLKFNSEQSGNIAYRIFDIRGKEVIAYQVDQLNGNWEVIIDVSSLSSGMYFIQIEHADEVLTTKLLKQD